MQTAEAAFMDSPPANAHADSFLGNLQSYWYELKNAPHGQRFRKFYDLRQSSRESGANRAVSIGVGSALLVFGVAIGWLPGPGGFVAILGLALLAQEFRPLASLLDWCERQMGHIWRAFKSLPVLGQGGVITALLAVGVGFMYLAYTAVL